ncbi:MAG: TatD family hydrolase [Mycobacteriales bacterium]
MSSGAGDRAGERAGHRAGEAPPPPEPLAVAVVDSHCHLDLMGGSVADALAAASAVGVTRVVSIGVDAATSRLQAELAAAHPVVWAGVAIHPNAAGSGPAQAAALEEIARLATLPQVRAVGETGLDHFRTPADGWAAQEDSFRAHIDIARAAGKALVIHDREAHEDVLRVLRDVGAPERTVFHCFSGDAAMAAECAERGYVVSFAGNLTFRNAQGLREAAAVVPADQLLVETDAPFLTPVPWRGRPNGPYLIPLTVRVLAEVRGADPEELCAAIWATAERVFGPL